MIEHLPYITQEQLEDSSKQLVEYVENQRHWICETYPRSAWINERVWDCRL